MKGVRIIIGTVILAVCPVLAAPEIPAAEAAGSLPKPPPVLHQIFGLMEQNRMEEASVLLETVRDSVSGFSPMKEYLSARLAFERGQYTEALQHLAQAENSGGRDSEWLPASVFLEGMIYKKNGQPEAAAYAAEELRLGWPGSVWSRRTEELK
jgi:hypothetical protein